MLCDKCALRAAFVLFEEPVAFSALPHLVCLQVDYATGELDRLRVLGPIDTKLFIGMHSRGCTLHNAAARSVFSH